MSLLLHRLQLIRILRTGNNVQKVVAGDTLSTIAQNAGIGLTQLLDLNPQFKANPDLITPGQDVTLPTEKQQTPNTPTPTPVQSATPEPTQQTSTPTPQTKTPVQTPTPVQPTQSVQPQAQQIQKTVIVKQGDTLSAIAKRELGDAKRWRELKTSSGNSFNAQSAKKLSIGTKLIIPQ